MDEITFLLFCLTISIPIALGRFLVRLGSESLVWGTGVVLAGTMVVNRFVDAIFRMGTGAEDWEMLLPMHLCDWALIATSIALIFRSRLWFEPAFFWASTGTLQAILTPNLDSAFPDYRWISFYIGHSGIVAGVIYLIVALRMRPGLESLGRAILWSELYFCAALGTNLMLGTNFGFLMERPAGFTLLNFLADDRLLYLIQVQLLGVAMFSIAYLPFALERWFREVRWEFGSLDTVMVYR